MLNKINNKPINIGILEISDQNKSILEFFFSNAGKALFKEVNSEDASAFIIDYDFPGAKENWKNTFSVTNKPGIIISIHEVDIPSAIWIAKPLTAQALTEAGHKIRSMLQEESSSLSKTSAKQTKKVEIIKEKEDFIEAVEPVNAKAESTATVIETAKEPQVAGLAIAGSISSTAIGIATSKANKLSSKPVAHKTSTKVATKPNKAPKNTIKQKKPVKINEDDKHEEIDDLLNSLISGKGEVASKDKLNKPSALQVTEETVIKGVAKPEIISTEKILTDVNLTESTDLPVTDLIDFTQEPVQDEQVVQKSISTTEDLSLGEISLETVLDVIEVKEPEATADNKVKQSALLNQPPITKEKPLIQKEATKKEQQKVNLIDSKTIETSKSYIVTDEKSSVGFEDFKETPVLNKTEKRVSTKDAQIATQTKEAPETHLFTNIEQTEVPKEKVVKSEKKAPLSPEEELQRLLDEIRKEADDSPVVGEDEGFDSQQSNIPSEKRNILTCGEWRSIASLSDLKNITFMPEEHMLATFLKILKQSRTSNTVMRLKFKGAVIVIDVKNDAIYCNTSILGKEYADICYDVLRTDEIKIHKLDKSEIRMYRTKMQKKPQNAHSIEAFIWTTSLVTSRGRLPEETDIKKKIGIRHWPNLTRLEPIPHMMQIAAVLKKHPGSLLEIPKWLSLPQSAVFAFYNGALALDLIEQNKSKLDSLKGLEKATKKKNRGFFSRLLKRITR